MTMRRVEPVARISLAVVAYLAVALMIPHFVSTAGTAALLDGAVMTGLVALGIGLTMIAGELDMSVGSMAALSSVCVILMVGSGINVFVALGVTVACALVFGAVQGWIIATLNMNSLVFTIGSLIGLRGIALYTANETTPTLPVDMLVLSDGFMARYGIFSSLSIVMLLAFAAVEFFAARTIFGREIYAIGGGRAESRAAGVPQVRPIWIAFALSAGFAALAGGLIAMRSGSASPLGFDAVLMQAVTACLIGGVALEGGKGRFLWVLLGLLTLRTVISAAASLGAPFWAQNLIVGLLLLGVIGAEVGLRSLPRRRLSRSAGAV